MSQNENEGLEHSVEFHRFTVPSVMLCRNGCLMIHHRRTLTVTNGHGHELRRHHSLKISKREHKIHFVVRCRLMNLNALSRLFSFS